MIWTFLFGYFFLCIFALLIVLEAFAWALRRVAFLWHPLKIVFGILSYCIFSFALILPLFGLEIIPEYPAANDEFTREVVLIAYLFLLLLLVLFFRWRHLDSLKTMGYFQAKIHK